MSTGKSDRGPGPEETNRAVRRFVLFFFGLLVLSTSWPAPGVWVVELFSGTSVDMPPRPFLGHEPPVWDAAFWAIAGSLLIAIVSSRVPGSRKRLGRLAGGLFAIPRVSLGLIRDLGALAPLAAILVGGVSIVLVALLADEAIVALFASFDVSLIYAPFRMANRLGGGANPVLIVVFVIAVGVYLGRARWIDAAVAMIWAGFAGGLLVRALKQGVARARPELWIGPFKTADPASGSFPSGHTMAAFIVAGVICFMNESRAVRVGGLLVATMVGVARIMNFRHWPSDVLASALIGLGLAWIFVRATEQSSREG